MIDIDFVVGISNQGSLDDTIKNLEKALQLQKDFGTTTTSTIKKVISDYNAYIIKIAELQKKLQGANDVKQIGALTGELEKQKKALDGINTEATKLNETRKKSNQLTDEELKDQIQLNEALNKRKKNIREAIKDQQALEIATKKEVTSIIALKEQTNALVRIRDRMSVSNKTQQKEFDTLTKKIATNEAQLKKYDSAIGRSQRNVGNYSSAFRGLGRSLLAIGGITLGASAIGSFFSQSAEDFRDFSAALQEVEAITGLAGKELEFFKQQALDAGKSGRVGATDYLEAVKLTGSARPELLKNKEALAALVEEGILLSKASKDTLPNSIAALTTTLNAFNIPANRAREVVDGLAAASQQGVQEIPYLTEAFTKFGGVAATAGVSVAESAAAVEVLGIKIPEASTAGLQLKNILIILQKEAARQKRPFEGLRKELDRYAGKVNDITFLTKTFKGENLLGIQTLIQQRKEFDRLQKAINETGTAQKQADANAKSAREQNDRLNNRLEALRIELGEKLIPAMNGFKEILVSITEFFVTASESVVEYARNIQSLNDLAAKELPNTIKRLNEFGETSLVNYGKSKNAILLLGKAQDLLNGATEQTKTEAEALKLQLEAGTISVEDFYKEAYRLYLLEGDRKKSITEETTAQDINTESTEEAAAAASAHAKASEDLFNKRQKLLDLEKTKAKIDIENTIPDEKEKAKALEQLDITFLEKKKALETQFGRNTLETELDILLAKNKIRKQNEQDYLDHINKLIDIQNQLDQLEIEAIKDGRTRDIAAAQKELKDKIAAITVQGAEAEALELALIEQFLRKRKEITEKYDKEDFEIGIENIERYYKEVELNTLESGQTQEKIDEELARNEIRGLEELLEERKANGEDVIELELELARKRNDIKNKEAEEEKKRREKLREDTIEFLKDTTDAISDELDRREELAQNEVEKQNERVEEQRLLAEQGLENTLAFEQELAAEKEKQLLEEQRKQEKLKIIESFFNALAAYSKDDPNTAPAKALAQTFIAKAIAAKLEDGGILEDEVRGQGGYLASNGIFKGNSHKNGGIKMPLAEFEGDEGILSKKEMRKLGKSNFYNLKKSLRGNRANELFKKQSEDSISLIQQKEVMLNTKPIENKLDELKKSIDDKPVPQINIDRYGNLIEKQIKKHAIHTRVHKGFNN